MPEEIAVHDEKKAYLEMYTIRSTENKFLLEISFFIYESDESLLFGTLLINVNSGDFSAKACMDVSAYEIAEFARDLHFVYEKLSGIAKLEETFYKQSYIEFCAKERGYIHVKGLLIDDGQTLCFENQFNQTYLNEFATELYHDYKQYLR